MLVLSKLQMSALIIADEIDTVTIQGSFPLGTELNNHCKARPWTALWGTVVDVHCAVDRALAHSGLL